MCKRSVVWMLGLVVLAGCGPSRAELEQQYATLLEIRERLYVNVERAEAARDTHKRSLQSQAERKFPGQSVYDDNSDAYRWWNTEFTKSKALDNYEKKFAALLVINDRIDQLNKRLNIPDQWDDR